MSVLDEVAKNLWHPRPIPQEHGCAATYDYLSLLFDHHRAKIARDPKMWGEPTTRRANDILRACRRESLPVSDTGVHKALLRALGGFRLEPVQLVSYPTGAEIADGYHRVSLAYALDPFMDVPCFILQFS